MHIGEPTEFFMRSLAEQVARGQSIDDWAISKDVNALDAREWIEHPEFRDLVEKRRLEHAERIVGKIASCADRAIDRLVEHSESAESISASLAATRALIDKWVGLSVYFVQEQKYEYLTSTVRKLLAARAADKKAAAGRG